jgi:hypothetical protein
MKKRAYIGKRKRDLDEECFQLALLQPRWDTYGRKIPGFTVEQIMAMSDEEREALKAECSLPSLVLPHPPVKFMVDGIEYCKCAGCASAIKEWRERTGRI